MSEPLPAASPPPGATPVAELCWRWGTPMEWRHATLQCPRCRFELGCCEGATADCSPRDR